MDNQTCQNLVKFKEKILKNLDKNPLVVEGFKLEVTPWARLLVLLIKKGEWVRQPLLLTWLQLWLLEGYKVLVIDMDPQGNASSALGSDPEKPTIYPVLCGEIPLSEVVQKGELENLFFISSNVHLSALEVEFIRTKSWESSLKTVLQPFVEDYEYIFIDCPPSLGPLTVNVLVASESFIVPLQCEYYALEGLTQLKETVKRIRENFNPPLRLRGILLTMF